MVLSRAGMTPPQLAPEVMAQRGGHGRQGVVLPRGPGGGWSPPHHRGTGVCPGPMGRRRCVVVDVAEPGRCIPPSTLKKEQKRMCPSSQSRRVFVGSAPK